MIILFVVLIFAAFINDENKGCGDKGLDLNSGWNWTPINQGWFFNSIISGSLLSGDIPEKINPLFSNWSLRLLLTSYLCLCLSFIDLDL